MTQNKAFTITVEGPDEAAKRRLAEVISAALADRGAYSYLDKRHGAIAPVIDRDLSGIVVHIVEPVPDELRTLTPSGQQRIA